MFLVASANVPPVHAALALDSGCTGSQQATTGTSITVTGISCAANDVIIVLSADYSNLATGVSSSPSQTWTSRGSVDTSGRDRISEWYAIASSTVTSITVTVSPSSQGAEVIVFGISGADTASPFDGAVRKNSGSSGSPTVSSVTTANAIDIIIGLEGHRSSIAETAGTVGGSAATLITTRTSSGAAAGAEYRVVSSTLSGASVTFGSSTSNWAMIVDAIKQAPTYTVTFTESGLPGGTSWGATFNGVTLTSTTTTITFTLIPAGTYSWNVSASISGVTGTRYVSSPTSGSMTVPTQTSQSITYTTQYLLTVNLNGHGTSSPVSGTWENSGAVVQVTIGSLGNASDTRYLYSGATGSGTGSYTGSSNPFSVTMNAPITESISWQTQYQLTMVVSPPGSGTTTPVVGTSWQNAGTILTISATQNNGYVFSSWTGSGSGSYTGPNNPATNAVTMNAPITETANFGQAAGTIVIQKSAVGGDVQFNFTATGTGLPASFSITTSGGSGSQTFSNLAPGAYSVTESGPSLPWLFTTLTCSAGGSVSGQTATISSLAAGQTVTCSYTDTKAGTIVINKSAVGGDATFNFTATGLTSPFSIITTSGSGSSVFNGLVPGSYSVTESGPSLPWVFTSLSCSPGGSVSGQTATIGLTAGSTVTCSYTDNKAGTIVINKSAVNGDAQFNFTATGTGLPASFSITTVGGSGSSTFSNLAPGAYSVSESGPSLPWSFTTLSCSSGGSVSGQTATISLTAGSTVTCSYTDTKVAGIVIQKTAVGGDAQFNFTATGTGLPASFSITTSSGSGGLSFNGLGPGAYSVSESGPSLPWLFTSLTCSSGGSVSGQSATITLVAGQTVTCSYTDTKAGIIVINKSAVGGDAKFNFTATGLASPFSITTTSGSGSSTFSNLIPGSYSVTESGPSSPWLFTTLTCSAGGSVSGQTATISSLAWGQTVTCSYTDARGGTIIINKSAVGGDAKFNFTSTGGNALPASFSITTTGGSGSSTFNGLVPGAYSVTESGPSSPWTFTSLSCSAGGSVSGQTVTISSLAAGQTVTCTYTDTKAGTIVINKSAVGGDAKFNFTSTGGNALPASFSITTTGGSGSSTFNGLVPGSYTVTESGPSLPWSFTTLSCSAGGSVSGQTATIGLTAGSTVTCTYTDTRVASIVINKSAVGGNAQFNFTATGTGLPASFSITTVGGSGSSTFSNLAPGAYSVTESGPSLPWSFTTLSCSAGGSVSGQTATISSLAAGQTVTCTYTDTKATTGSIVIQKSTVGGNAKFNFTATGTGLPASFSITTTSGSGTQTFSGLVPSAYTVVESGPSSPWSFTSLTCSGGSVVGQSVSVILAAGQTVTCTYTDTKTTVLSVSVNPAGSVNLSPSQPPGGYIGGTVVQATAQASSGYYFIGWALDGGYAGITNPLSVTMDNNHALTAYFQSQATIWPKYYNINYGYVIGPTTGKWDAYAVYGGRPFTIDDASRPSWLSTFCNNQPCKFGLIYTGDTAATGVGRAIGLAVSLDGYNWYKYSSTVLTAGPSGSWDSLRVATGQVIWDGSQYVMYYSGRSATTGVDAIGRATSTDLINWAKDANPVLTGVPSEGTGPVHPLVIKTGANAYRMWYTAPHPDTGISYIYLASSINGITWVRENSGHPVFSPSTDPTAWDSSLVYFEAVLYNSGTYTMFYSGCVLPLEGTICRIGYATSADGISWSRPSDNPIVTQAPADSSWPASWDINPVKDPGVAVFNGRIMIYYTGDDYAIGIAMQPVGTIVINKIAVGGNAQFNFTSTGGNALPASFSVTTTSGTGTQIFSNIAPGSYSVTESGPSSPWTFTSLSCSSGGSVSGQTATITLAADQTVTCTYTDTKAATGSIVIQKSAVGGNAQFNFTATGGLTTPFSITTTSGSGSQTFGNLIVGSYSVTESGPSLPWLFTSLTCSAGGSVSGQTATISLTAGQTVTCTYTDTKAGTIVIQKTAVGGDAQFNFTATGGLTTPFSITTVSGSGSVTFNGLASGSYSVTETGPSAPWLFTSLTCSAGGSVSGQTATISNLAAGQTVTCTYTDTKAGTIVVQKTAVGGNAQFNFTATGGLTTPFSITTVSGSGTQTFSSLAPGAYSVTESGPSSPWTFTSLTCSAGGSVSGQTATITLTAGATVTCTYTDSKAGTIVINKSAVGGDAQFNFTATGGLTTPFSITTVSGSGSVTFNGLASGSYSVTETGPSSPWSFTSLSCSAGGSVSGQIATISLTAGQTVTCTYTDSKVAGIVINKSAVGGDAQFNFTATGTGLPASFSITTSSGSGSQIFSSLASGSYSVTESGPSLPWLFTSLTCSAGGSVSGQTATITLAAGQTVTCTYTDSKVAGIVINKSALGGDAQFNFTATGTGLPASFTITTISGSGSQTFNGLAPGSYSVTESGPSLPWSFTSLTCSAGGSVSGQTATISLTAGSTVTCTFTDTKAGTIVIQKSAVGGDATFNFTATGLTSPFSITTVGGSGSSTFNGLVPGAYSVTESGPSSPWVFVSLTCSAGGSVSGQTATISSLAAGQTATCSYTDAKAAGIVIQKSAVGGNAQFNFTATGLASPFSITTVGGSGSQTFSNLIPGSYSVTESGPSLPWLFTTLTCSSGGSVVGQTATISSLAAGQTVTCTYTDTKVGTIVVNKSAVGGNAQFNFTATGGLTTPFSITTVSGSGSSTFSNLAPGAYSVTESGPSLPWSFTSLSCSSGGSVVGQTATITLAWGQTVTCSYTDAHGGTIVTMIVDYSLVGGGSPSPPIFNYIVGGVSKSLTLTATPVAVQVDRGSSWSVTPNPLAGSSSSERWRSNQALGGSASATTTLAFTYYHQFLMTLSYAVVGGGLGYSAPTFTTYQFGSSISQVLTTTATGYWFDAASSWSVPNPLLGSTSSQRWWTSLPTSGTISSARTVAFSYQHQYYLTMQASPQSGGTVSPSSGWQNAGISVPISASPATGFVFLSWTGAGTGSYTGTSNSWSIAMNGPITETANFKRVVTVNVVLRTMSAQPVVRNVLIQICADLYCSSVIKSESFTVSLSASAPVTKHYLVLIPPNTFYVRVNWGTSPTNWEQNVTFGSSPQTVTFMEGSTGPPRP